MYQDNKIHALTQRAIKAHMGLVQRCHCNPMQPLTQAEIEMAADQLGVHFSSDFIAINTVFDYAYLSQFEFFCVCYHGRSGVVEETLAFRQALQLPLRYVILSNPGDTWAVLMETQPSPDKDSPVLCCAPEDWDNICAEKPLEYEHTIWPSFTDFFEYLVEQEEAKLKDGA